jgi:hypothetical protein
MQATTYLKPLQPCSTLKHARLLCCPYAMMRSTTLGSRHIEFAVHHCESYSREKAALVGFDALLRDASGLFIRPRRYAKWMYLHCTSLPGQRGQAMESSPALSG